MIFQSKVGSLLTSDPWLLMLGSLSVVLLSSHSVKKCSVFKKKKKNNSASQTFFLTRDGNWDTDTEPQKHKVVILSKKKCLNKSCQVWRFTTSHLLPCNITRQLCVATNAGNKKASLSAVKQQWFYAAVVLLPGCLRWHIPLLFLQSRASFSRKHGDADERRGS